MSIRHFAAIGSLTLLALGTSQAATNFTGSVNNDINNAGNWDNGLPSKDATNPGTVTGFNVTGNPRDKNITYAGNSNYTGANFGGGEANGYTTVFTGTSSADFTGNGLFLAWDGGAANDSSFAWDSSGTADTTRFFASRFGAGTFSQSAGTINQNSVGGFDMVVGEFAPGVTWTMTGGIFNSAGSNFRNQYGSMSQLGGVVNGNIFDFGQGGAGSTFNWNIAGGTVNMTDIVGFNNADSLNFTVGSTGVVNVTNSNYSILDAEADINNGWITLGGAAATPADFLISLNGANTVIQIPEPSVGILAGLGVLGLCLRRRRRA